MARLGRDPEALRQYAAIGAEPLRAEDLYLIGQGLIRQGRSGLGTGALDAASKLDPNHQETITTLAGLHGRLGTPVADLAAADRLTAVPSGPALRQLVVGLLAIIPDKETPGGLDPTLDRLLHHGRAEFLAIDGPPAARKLLARLSLEQGRATEARGWLDKGDGVDDPETDWLRSRAYLVEGAIEQARESVVRAGDFGRDAPLTHEPSRYTGAKRCAGCHGAIYRTQQTSRHAQTLAQGESLTSVPLPKAAVADPEAPRVTHRFERSGSEIRVAVETDEGLIRAVVDYALGSGHHGVTMLARDESGRHRSMRISYYSAGDYWGITSGFNPHPTDRESYLGNALSDAGLRGCLDCHSTRYPPSEGKRSPEAADRGIGCERCHGPGDHHLRAVEAGFPQLAIARPKLATPCAAHGPLRPVPQRRRRNSPVGPPLHPLPVDHPALQPLRDRERRPARLCHLPRSAQERRDKHRALRGTLPLLSRRELRPLPGEREDRLSRLPHAQGRECHAVHKLHRSPHKGPSDRGRGQQVGGEPVEREHVLAEASIDTPGRSR